MMMLMWITLVLFSQTGSAQKNVLHQPNSVITAASGENVTLQCIRTNKKSTDPIIWYKQAAGHEPCVIVTIQKLAPNPIFEDEFKSPRFNVENLKESCNLKINNVEPSDEAMYYCGIKIFTIQFGKGTFLSVKDDRDVKVSVRQSGVLDSVPAGASVTLQCSVLSESRAAELQVLWFRAAPPQSHPQIIYTHHNSSHQCESDSSTHTCVYNFSKNILSLNDTGSYYCAVLLCGKIIFGNGTLIKLKESVDAVVICLTVALGVCALVISVQALLICNQRNHKQHTKGETTVKRSNQTNSQDHEFELNYAALHFNKKKTKGGTRTRKQTQEPLYSDVRSLTAM
ncbi:uncharacterized protein LOC132855930 isoform X1 [Tachysurus vachellii]|uniref:uncharacterized protein LOC132855930 isoform X1 n=1 Tax=Tachysurus vachellii TaxID=175792 RepID=UPI00296AB515|nr:uncharacterized protein LOC132855930 isoform X1 [Tachysurus vachellii]